MKYPLAHDTIPQTDLDALADWLRTSPRLTMGPLTHRFEEEFAAWLGRRHAVMVNSGSSANWLMALALKCWKPDVIHVKVPAIGWATTISPFHALRYELEFLDVDQDTWGLDAIAGPGEPNSALVSVPVLGVPCHARRDLPGILLEDACAALGSARQSQRCGTFGTMSSVSFFFSHQLSTVEGGMVLTDDGFLADLLRMLRAHGWAADLEPIHEATLWGLRGQDRSDFDRKFTFYVPGMNARPTEMQAFLGLRQLNRLDEVVARRIANDSRYRQNFSGAEYFRLQRPAEGDTVCSIAVGMLATSSEHRDRVAYALGRAGIETRSIGGGNLARQPFVNRHWVADKCPVADAIGRYGFQVPNGPHLAEADIDFICETILGVKPVV